MDASKYLNNLYGGAFNSGSTKSNSNNSSVFKVDSTLESGESNTSGTLSEPGSGLNLNSPTQNALIGPALKSNNLQLNGSETSNLSRNNSSKANNSTNRSSSRANNSSRNSSANNSSEETGSTRNSSTNNSSRTNGSSSNSSTNNSSEETGSANSSSRTNGSANNSSRTNGSAAANNSSRKNSSSAETGSSTKTNNSSAANSSANSSAEETGTSEKTSTSNVSSALSENSVNNAFQFKKPNTEKAFNTEISPNSLSKRVFGNVKKSNTQKLPRGLKLYLNKTPPQNEDSPLLERVFNAVMYKAYILQKFDTFMKRRKQKHPYFDMNYFWNPLNILLNKGSGYKAKKWNMEVDDEKIQEILRLNEVTEHGVINHRNHSLIQQMKIPLNEDPLVPNIIRVALYCGIYQGFVEGDGKKFNPEYPINSIYDVVERAEVIRLSVKLNATPIMEQVQSYLDIYKNPPKNFATTRRK